MSLHTHSGGADFVERGEAVHRHHDHAGSIWRAVVAWFRVTRARRRSPRP